MDQSNANTSRVLGCFKRLFKVFTGKVFEELEKNDDFRKEPLFYHYTSLTRLQKIIERKTLRATSIYMQNDPNELFAYEDILNLYSDEISKKLLKIHPSQSFDTYPTFIFCPSKLTDDMHLWEKIWK